MEVGDNVIVSEYGVKVAGVILNTRPCKDFPAFAGEECTMYQVELTEWFGNAVWLPESKLQPALEFTLEIP